MTPFTNNDYAVEARARKAAVLAVHARQNGITSADITAMDDEVRKALAVAAGTRVPSEDTWNLVLDALAVFERCDAAEDPYKDNPFKRFPNRG